MTETLRDIRANTMFALGQLTKMMSQVLSGLFILFFGIYTLWYFSTVALVQRWMSPDAITFVQISLLCATIWITGLPGTYKGQPKEAMKKFFFSVLVTGLFLGAFAVGMEMLAMRMMARPPIHSPIPIAHVRNVLQLLALLCLFVEMFLFVDAWWQQKPASNT